ERRLAALPIDRVSLSLNDTNRGYGPKTHNNVAIRQFGQAVSVRPRIARLLDRRDPIYFRIEMLPDAIFPDRSPKRRHLDQIVSIHFAVMLSTCHPASDFRSQFTRELSETEKQHIAVSKTYGVVMMIGTPYLP